MLGIRISADSLGWGSGKEGSELREGEALGVLTGRKGDSDFRRKKRGTTEGGRKHNI